MRNSAVSEAYDFDNVVDNTVPKEEYDFGDVVDNTVIAQSGASPQIAEKPVTIPQQAPPPQDRTFGEYFGGGVDSLQASGQKTAAFISEKLGNRELAESFLEDARLNEEQAAAVRYQPKHGDTGFKQALNITDPEFAQATAGQAIPGSAPFLTGMVAGGVGGFLIGGPPGMIIGASLAGGATVFGQEIGDAYYDFLDAHPDDPQGATNYALKKAAVSGGINAASVPLSLVGAGNPITVHAAKQALIQPGIGMLDTGAGNLLRRDNVDPNQPLSQGLAESALGEFLVDAGPMTAAGSYAAGQRTGDAIKARRQSAFTEEPPQSAQTSSFGLDANGLPFNPDLVIDDGRNTPQEVVDPSQFPPVQPVITREEFAQTQRDQTVNNELQAGGAVDLTTPEQPVAPRETNAPAPTDISPVEAYADEFPADGVPPGPTAETPGIAPDAGLPADGLPDITPPVNAETPSEIDIEAHQAATSPLNALPEPTEDQKKAGNYKKGNIKVHGLDISIENPKGSTRSGKDAGGNEWSQELNSHYGYIKKTEGADGDHVDVFVGESPESPNVHIVDQVNQDGRFDEHKVMIGYPDREQAIQGYRENYDEGWTVGPVSTVSVDRFKQWLKKGNTKVPYNPKLWQEEQDANYKPPAGWEKNILKARKYADHLGVPHKDLKLPELRKRIRANLAGETTETLVDGSIIDTTTGEVLSQTQSSIDLKWAPERPQEAQPAPEPTQVVPQAEKPPESAQKPTEAVFSKSKVDEEGFARHVTVHVDGKEVGEVYSPFEYEDDKVVGKARWTPDGALTDKETGYPWLEGLDWGSLNDAKADINSIVAREQAPSESPQEDPGESVSLPESEQPAVVPNAETAPESTQEVPENDPDDIFDRVRKEKISVQKEYDELKRMIGNQKPDKHLREVLDNYETQLALLKAMLQDFEKGDADGAKKRLTDNLTEDGSGLEDYLLEELYHTHESPEETSRKEKLVAKALLSLIGQLKQAEREILPDSERARLDAIQEEALEKGIEIVNGRAVNLDKRTRDAEEAIRKDRNARRAPRFLEIIQEHREAGKSDLETLRAVQFEREYAVYLSKLEETADDTPPVIQSQPVGSQREKTKLQPRLYRDSKASVAQMKSIARNPDPLLLTFSNTGRDGAPLAEADDSLLADSAVGNKGTAVVGANRQRVEFQFAVVEADRLIASHTADGTEVAEYADGKSGHARVANNGRTAGLKSAYQQGTADNYRQYLIDNADEFGLDSGKVAEIDNPIMVRVVRDGFEDVAALTNESTELATSSVEDAVQDALKIEEIPPIDAERGLQSGQHRDFIVKILHKIANENEIRRYIGEDGVVTELGYQRVRNAILARAYGDPEIVQLVSESNESRNVAQALLAAAPAFASLPEGNIGGADSRPTVVEAVKLFQMARQGGKSVDSLVSTRDIFSGNVASPLAESLALFLDQHRTRSKTLRDALVKIGKDTNFEHEHSQTEDMLDRQPRSLEDIINDATEDQGEGQLTLMEPIGELGWDLDTPKEALGKDGKYNARRDGRFDDNSSDLMKGNAPIVVFHGSPDGATFVNFDLERSGSRTGSGSARDAIWFTDSRDIAGTYANSHIDMTDRYSPFYNKHAAPMEMLARDIEWFDLENHNPRVEQDGDEWLAKYDNYPNQFGDIFTEVEAFDSEQEANEWLQETIAEDQKARQKEYEKHEVEYKKAREKYDKMSAIKRVHLIMENPLVVTGWTPYEGHKGQGMTSLVEEAREKGHDGLIVYDTLDAFASLDEIEQQAREDGDQSVFDDYTSTNYAVFSPEQVIDAETGKALAPREGKVNEPTGTGREGDTGVPEQDDGTTTDLEGRHLLLRDKPERADGGRTKSGRRPVAKYPQDKLIGSATPSGFDGESTATLIGREVSGIDELAELAQIYRNPQYETFRIIFTKGSKIVEQTGVTSRLPGASTFQLEGESIEATIARFRKIKENSGADGYYLMHNHPSGNPTASTQDIDATATVNNRLQGFKGHIIINEDQYGLITAKDFRVSSEIVQRDFPPTYRLSDHAVPHEWIGKQTLTTDAMAQFAKGFQASDDYIVIYSYQNGVQGITEIPTPLIDKPIRFRAALRRFARHTGGLYIFAVNVPVKHRAAIKAATEDGTVLAAIFVDGTQILPETPPGDIFFGAKQKHQLVREPVDGIEDDDGGNSETRRMLDEAEEEHDSLYKEGYIRNDANNYHYGRIHDLDKEKLFTLADSMRKNGWVGPPAITYDSGEKEATIVAGNHRVTAAIITETEIEESVIDDDRIIAELSEAHTDEERDNILTGSAWESVWKENEDQNEERINEETQDKMSGQTEHSGRKDKEVSGLHADGVGRGVVLRGQRSDTANREDDARADTGRTERSDSQIGKDYRREDRVLNTPIDDLSPSEQKDARSQVDEAELAAILEMDGRSRRKKVVDWLKDKTPYVLKNALAFVPRQYLVDFVPKEVVAVKEYTEEADLMSARRNHLMNEEKELIDDWMAYASKNRKENKELADLMHLGTIAGFDLSKPYEPLPDKKSSREKEQQRRQTWMPLKSRWNALIKASPDAEQIYIRARDRYANQRELVFDALKKKIARSEASDSAKEDLIKLLESDFKKSELAGAYFPLQRFGEFFVDVIDPTTDERIDFQMFESEAKQLKFVEKMEKTNLKVSSGRISEGDRQKNSGVDAQFAAAVTNVLKGVDPRVATALRDEIWQLYLKTLPELSQRKRFIHRKNTPGYNGDALRAFAHNMFHGAHQLAKLEYRDKLESLIKKGKKQVRELSDPKKRNSASIVMDELSDGHQWTMDPDVAGWAVLMTFIGFAYNLGLNISSSGVNLSQTLQIAYSVLGAKFGYKNAIKALGGAAKDMIPGIGKRTASEELALEQLEFEGKIDNTQGSDLAGTSERGENYVSTHFKVQKIFAFLFHKAERINRTVTGLAAYRLAIENKYTHGAAVQYAKEALDMSHYNYENSNRARVFRGNVARPVLLFKQYPLNTTIRMWIDLRDSIKHESPEVRREAKRRFIGIQFVTLQMAGFQAMFLVSLFTWLIELFGDDDDPLNVLAELRTFLADFINPTAADVIMTGWIDGLTDIAISQRISLSNLWFRDSRDDLDEHKQAEKYMIELLGPWASMTTNVIKGAGRIADGETWRGMEIIPPRFISNPLRAYREATEGVTTLSGATIIDKDEISAVETMARAAGFGSSKVQKTFDQNWDRKERADVIRKRYRLLMDRYFKAISDGDQKALDSAVKDLVKFSGKHPWMGLTNDSINKSLKARERAMARLEAYGGIHFGSPAEAAQMAQDINYDGTKEKAKN